MGVDFELDTKIMFGAKKLEKYAGKTIVREIGFECEYMAKRLVS